MFELQSFVVCLFVCFCTTTMISLTPKVLNNIEIFTSQKGLVLLDKVRKNWVARMMVTALSPEDQVS